MASWRKCNTSRCFQELKEHGLQFETPFLVRIRTSHTEYVPMIYASGYPGIRLWNRAIDCLAICATRCCVKKTRNGVSSRFQRNIRSTLRNREPPRHKKHGSQLLIVYSFSTNNVTLVTRNTYVPGSYLYTSMYTVVPGICRLRAIRATHSFSKIYNRMLVFSWIKKYT